MDWKKTWLSIRCVAMWGLAVSGLLMMGCEPECVKSSDCLAYTDIPKLGQEYVCTAHTCVSQDIPSTKPGPDAGTPPGPDVGTSPGSDAGAPPEDVCKSRPHDEKLGTLQLQEGFRVVESAPLPEDIYTIDVVSHEGTHALYGVDILNSSVYALGNWPNIAASTTPLYPIAPADEQQDEVYSNGILVNDGAHLLSAYARLFDTSGKVSLYDTTASNAPTYVSVTENTSALGLPGAFLVTAASMDGVSDKGPGVYALRTASSPVQAAKLATFPVTDGYGGPSAVASNQVIVLGYVRSTPTQDNAHAITTYLRAASPETYRTALKAGTSIELSGPDTPEVYAEAGFLEASGFGAGVALLRATPHHKGGYGFSDISRIALAPTDGDGKGVSAGKLQRVLVFVDKCTGVEMMAPLAGDLLIGVTDRNGRRLVRLHAETP